MFKRGPLYPIDGDGVMPQGIVYDYAVAIASAWAAGLAFNWKLAARADKTFAAYGLKQAEVDMAMAEHVKAVADLFDPSNYRWRHRLLIALHFLNPFAGGR